MQLNLLSIRLYNFLETNKRFFVFLPLWIYWLLLLFLTSYPTKSMPAFGIGDKFEHLFAYFIFSFLLQLTFHFQNKYSSLNRKPALYTWLIATGYGIFDELHQIFIPGRSCDILDLLSDIIGIALAVFIVSYIIKSATQIKEPVSL